MFPEHRQWLGNVYFDGHLRQRFHRFGQCNDGDNFSTINFADVNGDGMADLVYRGDTGIQVWLSTGTGLTPGWSSDICANGSTAYGSCNDGDNFSNIYYPDINGDGRADLCYRSDTGIKCFLSTGSGWGTFISTDICANGSTAYGQCNDGDNFSTINFADVNGDGMADLVYRGDTGIQVWLSTGTGFTPGWSSDVCANGSTAYGQCNDGDNFSTIRYVDVNGDGLPDVVFRSDTGIQIILTTGSVPHLLKSVANGLGAVTNITNKPLTDNTVYTKESGSVYPYQDIQNATYVVSSYSMSDGIGGTINHSYTYAGAKNHATRNEWLGFRHMEALNTSSGVKSITEYNQVADGTQNILNFSATVIAANNMV